MKENIQKFREEAQKLEQSDALKSARQKFNVVEAEAQKSGDILKQKIGLVKGKMQDVIEEAGKTEIAKLASQLGEEFSKSAKDVTSTIAEKGKELSQTGAFHTISKATDIVQKEINSQNVQGRVYRSPKYLRKRVDISKLPESRSFKQNTEVLDVELHKDSKLYQSWENFKSNNTYLNKILDWRYKYEESENPVVRASRLLTDKVSDVFGNLFSKTELSETLTELCRIDPNFDQKSFLRDCETDIIPNILEAMVRGNLEILKDWCFEGAYNIIAAPINQAIKYGYYLDSKILDIEGIDLIMGKVMPQGPVLIITFQSQQIMCIRDQAHKIVEGDPEKVMRVNHVWVLCRDPEELNSNSAWRLMELSTSSTEQFV